MSIDFFGTKLWQKKKQELLKHNNFYFCGSLFLDLWILVSFSIVLPISISLPSSIKREVFFIVFGKLITPSISQ